MPSGTSVSSRCAHISRTADIAERARDETQPIDADPAAGARRIADQMQRFWNVALAADGHGYCHYIDSRCRSHGATFGPANAASLIGFSSRQIAGAHENPRTSPSTRIFGSDPSI